MWSDLFPTKTLLGLSPKCPASAEPLIDHLTRRMTAAYRNASPSQWRRLSIDECSCGADGDSCDFILPNGTGTSALCIHYLAHHRAEVPVEQLAEVETLACGECEPTQGELQGPTFVERGLQAMARKWASRSIDELPPPFLTTWVSWGLDVAQFRHWLERFKVWEERLLRQPWPISGGCIVATRGYDWYVRERWYFEPEEITKEAEDRRAAGDARAMFLLLRALLEVRLGKIEAAIRRCHGSLHQWGQAALRMPGWNREPWREPLAALIRDCPEAKRDSLRNAIGNLSGAFPELNDAADEVARVYGFMTAAR